MCVCVLTKQAVCTHTHTHRNVSLTLENVFFSRSPSPRTSGKPSASRMSIRDECQNKHVSDVNVFYAKLVFVLEQSDSRKGK